MKLNCHICAKYLPLLWLHTNACLSFHFMQLSKSKASSSVSRTIHSSRLTAKFEEVCSTIMALEMYLAEDKSSMPLSALPGLWALTSQPWLQPKAGRTQLTLLSEGWKDLGVFPRLDLPSDTQPWFSACRAKHHQQQLFNGNESYRKKNKAWTHFSSPWWFSKHNFWCFSRNTERNCVYQCASP